MAQEVSSNSASSVRIRSVRILHISMFLDCVSLLLKESPGSHLSDFLTCLLEGFIFATVVRHQVMVVVMVLRLLFYCCCVRASTWLFIRWQNVPSRCRSRR